MYRIATAHARRGILYPPNFRRARYLTAASTAPKAEAVPHPNEAFLQGNAANYIDAIYEQWKATPSSVHVSWQIYFSNIQSNQPPSTAFIPPPNIVPSAGKTAVRPSLSAGSSASSASSGWIESEPDVREFVTGKVSETMKVQLLQRAYQTRGHHIATLDPLGINQADLNVDPPAELTPAFYGFSEADMEREFTLGPGILPRFISPGKTTAPLREIIEHLKAAYSGNIGVEYAHIADRKQCDWIRERIEVPKRYNFTREEKFMIMDRLMWSDSFERFVASKWSSEKRFGLEGCEVLIPGMKALIDRSVENGVSHIVIGMPHRGRLNVLSNVVRKPNESIFSEFKGTTSEEEGSGDVKYHLGMKYDRPTPSGKMVRLYLEANPSHLEAVNPVVLGHTRALQWQMGDETHSKAMSVLIHGDAAFAGQGVVYETLGLTELPAYTTGGTIHIIVNNQIGFTTDPRYSRSTPYCSDVAKTVGAPIFHVNADDPEAVTLVSRVAADWRSTFKKDVVIDLVCYRRYGHNEMDQPSFTQPRMYEAIKSKERVLDHYLRTLRDAGEFKDKEIEDNKRRIWNLLEQSYEGSKDYRPTSQDWVSSTWPGFKSPQELAREITPLYDTGVDPELLKSVGIKASSFPADFNAHPLLQKILKGRKKTIEDGEGIDMPTAEALSLGTLLVDGKNVRLSGQDVQRGTFSQRHSVYHEQKTERQYVPLQNLSPGSQGDFMACNSSLSEFGILGFELGYSLVDPHTLVIWEAQFGDFANNAQCIIDQFLVSMEQKWVQRSGLVLNLPHGFDGQGPEHSSARLERFLQLCDDHPYKFPPEMSVAMQRQHQDCNVQVVYPSTPANYFHVLRRQIYREFRKPLVLCFSKSLLRHGLARSSLLEMGPGTRFLRFYPEVLHNPEISPVLTQNSTLKIGEPATIKRLVFCTGQLYYALFRAREVNQVTDLAIARIEQLHPFPYDKVCEFLEMYPNADQIVWAQEEPLNNGAFTFAKSRLATALSNTAVHANRVPVRMPGVVDSKGRFVSSTHGMVEYAGRDPSASVATGNKKQHVLEEQQLISSALFGEVRPVKEIKNGSPVYEK